MFKNRCFKEVGCMSQLHLRIAHVQPEFWLWFARDLLESICLSYLERHQQLFQHWRTASEHSVFELKEANATPQLCSTPASLHKKKQVINSSVRHFQGWDCTIPWNLSCASSYQLSQALPVPSISICFRYCTSSLIRLFTLMFPYIHPQKRICYPGHRDSFIYTIFL